MNVDDVDNDDDNDVEVLNDEDNDGEPAAKMPRTQEEQRELPKRRVTSQMSPFLLFLMLLYYKSRFSWPRAPRLTSPRLTVFSPLLACSPPRQNILAYNTAVLLASAREPLHSTWGDKVGDKAEFSLNNKKADSYIKFFSTLLKEIFFIYYIFYLTNFKE